MNGGSRDGHGKSKGDFFHHGEGLPLSNEA